MIANYKYTSIDIIHANITRKYKQKGIQRDDIMEWCMQCELQYIKDVESMPLYTEIDLTVDANGEVLLPCNIFRILDVYDSNGRVVEHKSNGAYLYDLKNSHGSNSYYKEGDCININYIGIMIDCASGEPMIAAGHENAAETYCKIQIFEEAVANRQFDANLWMRWKDEFHGQHLAARYESNRGKTRDEVITKSFQIRGNALAHIGGLKLHHTIFNDLKK